jgi:hypothetical protein
MFITCTVYVPLFDSHEWVYYSIKDFVYLLHIELRVYVCVCVYSKRMYGVYYYFSIGLRTESVA